MSACGLSDLPIDREGLVERAKSQINDQIKMLQGHLEELEKASEATKKTK